MCIRDSNHTVDWWDLANYMVDQVRTTKYHVVVVDEAQDFSANQVRAVMNHVDDAHSVTFVLDAAQRIYPQSFTWAEVGMTVGPSNSKQLSRNFRNTVEIAAFAASLLNHVEITDDASMPDLTSCTVRGDKPVLVSGTFTPVSYTHLDVYKRQQQDRERVDDVFLARQAGQGVGGTAQTQAGELLL